MEISYTDNALKDLKYWKKIKNKEVQKRISDLLDSITETPYKGIGNPEPLKHGLTGYWSRKINKEHRIIYRLINDNTIEIYSLRLHYK
ncbi:MAG: Txe/YoeB family addiction module toxin [Bacteroidales bacterium]|nr:Txe/YoeB family addiction module toxin [Bacteroidales bacterium]